MYIPSSRSVSPSPVARGTRRLRNEEIIQSGSRLITPQPLQEKIKITTHCKVSEIKDIQELPPCWPILEDTAFRIDLTDCTTIPFLNENGNMRNMCSVVRGEDSDSWKTGTGGNTSQTIKVFALDGIPCRRAELKCSGTCKCEYLDGDLLGDRTEPDPGEMKRLFEAERAVNELQYSVEDVGAAAFVFLPVTVYRN